VKVGEKTIRSRLDHIRVEDEGVYFEARTPLPDEPPNCLRLTLHGPAGSNIRIGFLPLPVIVGALTRAAGWNQIITPGSFARPFKPGAKTYYAATRWLPEDVQSVKPGMTLEEATEFLTKNEKHLRDRLVELGHEIIAQLLSEES